MLEKAIPYLLSMEWNRGLTSVEPPFFFLDDSEKRTYMKQFMHLIHKMIIMMKVKVGQLKINLEMAN